MKSKDCSFWISGNFVAAILPCRTDQVCSSQRQSLINLAKLKSHGVTKDRIVELNNFLESNGHKDTRSNTYASIK